MVVQSLQLPRAFGVAHDDQTGNGDSLLLKDFTPFVGGLVLNGFNSQCFRNGLPEVFVDGAHSAVSIDFRIASFPAHIPQQPVELSLVGNEGLIHVIGNIEVSPEFPVIHRIILVE